MKQVLIGLAVAIAAALLSAPQAEASSFMTITVGVSSVTCNNSTAASLAACPAGFTSAVGAGTMSFMGTVGGYIFGAGGSSGIELVSMDTPGLANTVDTKTAVIHFSGTDSAVIDYGVNGFTTPTGLDQLSASHSGTAAVGAANDMEAFRSWERNDNMLVGGPAGATAVSLASPCTFTAAAPPTQACMGPTSTIGSPNVISPFALTSEETITTAIGFVGSFIGTTDLTPVPAPEPSSLILLGTGLLMVAGLPIRKFRNRK